MARRSALARRLLDVTQLEDRTVPSSVPISTLLPPIFPPIGMPGGALSAGNDIADTDGNNPVTIDVLANDRATTGFAIVPTSVQMFLNPARGTVAVDQTT